MPDKKENPFINLIANVLLPVLILNKTAMFPGDHKALLALGTALFFPLAYGLWDLLKNSKTNYFSILGVVNTLITGVFALYQLSGNWFAFKEAAMPAVLGLLVYFSSLKGKPFFKTFISMSGLLKSDLIEEKALELNTVQEVEDSYLKANNFFALSFLFSAALNFVLAIYIFTPLPEGVSEEAAATLLNEQISKMTWMGMLVIALPMMFFLAATLFQLFKNLKIHTGLSQDEILNNPS